MHGHVKVNSIGIFFAFRLRAHTPIIQPGHRHKTKTVLIHKIKTPNKQ